MRGNIQGSRCTYGLKGPQGHTGLAACCLDGISSMVLIPDARAVSPGSGVPLCRPNARQDWTH